MRRILLASVAILSMGGAAAAASGGAPALYGDNYSDNVLRDANGASQNYWGGNYRMVEPRLSTHAVSLNRSSGHSMQGAAGLIDGVVPQTGPSYWEIHSGR